MMIVMGAGLVMKAIIEEGEDEVNIDKLFNVWIIMKVITSGWLQDARACPGRGGPAPASPVCSVHPVGGRKIPDEQVSDVNVILSPGPI